MNKMPLELRLEKAKSELKEIITMVEKKYLLPPFLMETIIQNMLLDLTNRKLSEMCEQISIEEKEIENDKD